MEIKEILASGATGAIGMGLQTLAQPILQGQNLRNQKKLAQYQQQLALDTWNKTNYEAQRKHMEKAGLNVGLMYGLGGGGGATTTGGQGGGIGYAPDGTGMGMQIGLMAEQTHANVQLAKAQANLANAQAKKIGTGEPTEVGTERGFLAEQITNEKTRGEILTFERDMKRTEEYLQRMTVDEALDQIRNESARVKEALDADKRANKMGDETYKSAVEKIKNDAIEGSSRIALNRAGVKKAEAETEVSKQMLAKIKQEIFNMNQEQLQAWTKLGQAERELRIKQQLAEFQLDTPEKIRQWTTIATDIIGTVAGVIK